MELHAYERMAQSLDPMLMPCQQEMPEQMTIFPAQTPPGMAYVPFQQWGEPYDAETGFGRGTMFPVLDLPFAPGEGGMGK